MTLQEPFVQIPMSFIKTGLISKIGQMPALVYNTIKSYIFRVSSKVQMNRKYYAAYHMNTLGFLAATVSQEKLAALLGSKRQTVSKAINRLVEYGFLQKAMSSNRQINTYVLGTWQLNKDGKRVESFYIDGMLQKLSHLLGDILLKFQEVHGGDETITEDTIEGMIHSFKKEQLEKFWTTEAPRIIKLEHTKKPLPFAKKSVVLKEEIPPIFCDQKRTCVSVIEAELGKSAPIVAKTSQHFVTEQAVSCSQEDTLNKNNINRKNEIEINQLEKVCSSNTIQKQSSNGNSRKIKLRREYFLPRKEREKFVKESKIKEEKEKSCAQKEREESLPYKQTPIKKPILGEEMPLLEAFKAQAEYLRSFIETPNSRGAKETEKGMCFERDAALEEDVEEDAHMCVGSKVCKQCGVVEEEENEHVCAAWVSDETPFEMEQGEKIVQEGVEIGFEGEYGTGDLKQEEGTEKVEQASLFEAAPKAPVIKSKKESPYYRLFVVWKEEMEKKFPGIQIGLWGGREFGQIKNLIKAYEPNGVEIIENYIQYVVRHWGYAKKHMKTPAEMPTLGLICSAFQQVWMLESQKVAKSLEDIKAYRDYAKKQTNFFAGVPSDLDQSYQEASSYLSKIGFEGF